MLKNLFFYKSKAKTKNDLLILSDSNYNIINNFYYETHPWNNEKQYFSDYKLITKIEKDFILFFKNQFKKEYSLNRPLPYWNIIFLPSIYYALSFIRARYSVLNRINNSHKINKFYLPSYKLEEWIPKTTSHLMKNIKDPNFSTIIYSEIAKLFFEEKSDISKSIIAPKYLDRISLSRKIKIINLLNIKKTKTIINESYLNAKIFNLFDNNKYFFEDNFQSTAGVDLYDRDIIFNFSYKNYVNSYFKIAKKLIKYFIPKSIIEDLDSFKRFPNINNVIAGTKIISDDFFKKFCANHILEKKKLYIIQHGGSYDSLKFNQLEVREKKISKFIQWGKNKNKSIKLLSATKLLGRKLNNNFNSKKIIFFAQNYTLKVNHFGDGPYTPLKHINFQKDQLNTILKIKKLLNASVHIKVPPFNEYESNSFLNDKLKKKKINFISRDVKIDNILKNFKYAVTMDSGTIFLELLGLGYPCFLIKKDFWNFSKKFNKHLNNLKKINIVFNTAEDLNFFLKKNDLNHFWSKTLNNQSFLNFQKSYCYLNSKKPYDDWKFFLKNL